MGPLHGPVAVDNLQALRAEFLQFLVRSVAVSPAERSAMTLRELEGRSPPLLVVLDNLAEWTSSRKPQPLPDGAHVRFLVTTRQQGLGGSAFAHVPLDILDADASRALLERIADRGPLPEVDPLLEHLGGHPLALELAGAYLRRYKEQSPSTYLAKLKAGEAESGHEKVVGKVSYEKTVDAADSTSGGRTARP